MINSKKLKIIFVAVGCLILLVQFQNCAKLDFQFEDKKATETLNFIGYHYEKATPIYFEVQVAPTTSTATMQSYSFIAIATNSNGSTEAISYTLNIYGVKGDLICATKMGLLVNGETHISESCSINKNIKIGKVVFQVNRLEGQPYEFVKVYNL